VDWRRAIKPNQRVALLPAAGAACERRDGLKYSRPKTFLFYNKCYSLFEGHWWEGDTVQHPVDTFKAREFSIGDLCDRFSVTPRTLRFYEGRGLIAPKRSGRTRIYSSEDVARIEKIVALKSYRFSLAEIAVILRQAARPGYPFPLTVDQVSKQITLLQDELRATSQAIEDMERLRGSMLKDANGAAAPRVVEDELVGG
jgi:DNA-binding transcriptional MerR regulator